MEGLDVIKEGDHVIFDEHGEKKSMHVIAKNGLAKVGKFRIPVGQLIGVPWGSTYKLAVDGSRLIPVAEHEPVLGPVVDEVEKDNRHLVDLNQQNQHLKQEDIEAMAASGKGGEDIIAALCSNSATFEGKTEFAQEKYKKRKARKYMTSLTLRRPTSWGMCEVMFDKAPTGIWSLRPDSLALLLSLANVAGHSRVLLLEHCQGLLAAACAERLGGHGVLCCVGTGGRTTVLSGLRQLNLGPQQRSIVSTAQLTDVQAAAQRVAAARQQAQQPNGSSISQQEQKPRSPAEQAAEPAAAEPAAAAAAGPAAEEPSSKPDEPAAAPMAVDDAPAEPSPAHRCAAPVGVPVAAAAAVDAPAAAEDAVHDEIMALYDNIQDDETPVSGTAAKSSPNSHQHHKAKKQRRGAAVQQQDAAQDAAAAAAPPQQEQQQQQQGQEQRQQQGEEAEGQAGRSGDAANRPVYAATATELEQLLTQGFNSCIIAAPRLHTGSILQQVLPLLAPSTPFAVFSPWAQPLAEAMQQLTSSKQAVLLQLQESWLRPYQVLPGRTHPHMNMTTGGTGGYILSGITVAPSVGGQPEQGSGGGGRGSGGGRRGGGAPRGGRRGKRR